jgi:ubiquinone/menaquinone biosynthesis C-methylase UbiE
MRDPKEASGFEPFDADVKEIGSYLYTSSRAPLSSLLANLKQSEMIRSVLPGETSSLCDIGCGDGTYTTEFLQLGIKEVWGIDPSKEAIQSAKANFGNRTAKFVQGTVGDLNRPFDVAVLRGVLHHAQDPEEVLNGAARVAKSVIVLEPNGLNPILKIIEKTSPYHIAHGEQSFSPKRIKFWATNCGLNLVEERVAGLVPFFAPRLLTRALKALEPAIEGFAGLRQIACGSRVFLFSRAN